MSILQHRTICGFCLLWLGCTFSLAEDWPQFRGPRGQGVSLETDLPLTWGPTQNIRWRAELPGPGNNGSPIVSQGKVFVTVAVDEGAVRSLRCYDRDTGDLLWERSVDFAGEEPTHRSNQYGGTTPVADDERVVVWHSSAGMHCYDHEGQPLWSRDLGPFVHIWGYGASPIIYKDLVINNCGPGERQRMAALDKRTGDVVWQTDEPGGTDGKQKPWIGSWSTPVIAAVDGQDQILTSYPHHVNAYEPGTGKVLWQRDGLGRLVYTSCLVGDGQVVAMGGYHGPAMAFTPGDPDIAGRQAPLWRMGKNPQRIGSGVILGENMFMASERGEVQCSEVASGKVLWEDRLPTKSRLWASLVAAAGRLYVTTQAGETLVFAANPNKFEQLAVNELGETSNSTIAVSEGKIFLRTWKALYCIEDGSLPLKRGK